MAETWKTFFGSKEKRERQAQRDLILKTGNLLIQGPNLYSKEGISGIGKRTSSSLENIAKELYWYL